MKKKRYILVKSLAAAVLLAFSACTQDEIVGGGDSLLPDGQYPLLIGDVSIVVQSSEEPWDASPQTRVTESDDGNSSMWQVNDVIGMRLEGTTYVASQHFVSTGQYYVKDVSGANVSLAPVEGKEVYWKSTYAIGQNQNIINYGGGLIAWYPDEAPISLSDQSKALAYVMKGESDTDENMYYYDDAIPLTFTHQLAKVRVALAGERVSQVTKVEVYGYTSCTNTQGTVTTEGASQGWITMHNPTEYGDGMYWEANVVPDVLIDRVKVNGIETTLTTSLTPVVAALNTITISVKQAPTEIDLSTYEGTMLTVSGKTTIKGNGQQKNLQVTVEPDTELTLQDVNLSYKGLAPVVFKGDATLTLEGANTLEGECVAHDFDTGSGIYIEQGTLTIDADNEDASLTISRKYNVEPNSSAGMGIYVPDNASLIIKSGKITVNNVSSEGDDSGAGIGTRDDTCGNITIEGGNITVGKCSWYAAGIGSLDGDCKGITITGENTVVNVSKGNYASCYIGSGYGTVTGNITIDGGATVNGVKYTDEKPHTGPL